MDKHTSLFYYITGDKEKGFQAIWINTNVPFFSVTDVKQSLPSQTYSEVVDEHYIRFVRDKHPSLFDYITGDEEKGFQTKWQIANVPFFSVTDAKQSFPSYP